MRDIPRERPHVPPDSYLAAIPIASSAERRLVSVLFADLVGFTTLSEHRDPEEVRELLSRYFDTAKALISRYGGSVEKFIGDAVMAVWGTPVAHEDDAERAVRAALELVETVSAIGSDVGAPDLRLRAGVLTGEAAVTLGAEGQGMVAGDLVNTASRLQSAAAPGAVLVGETTFLAVRDAIAFEEAGEHVLKGKESPVRAWRALRVVAQRGGAGRAEALEGPFVGRDRELRQIKDLFHATEQERRPRLLSIMGIGGIGKSRLAWEFLKYIDGLVYDVYWHQGRSPAYGEGVAFWALGEIVRMRCGIAEGEDAPSSLEKLGIALNAYVVDPEERRWIEPRLAHLLGLEERPAGEREELFAAWRVFFERIAEQGPTVLVFEDLQWADPGQIDFIEHMLEWSRTYPIFIITLARPELMDRRPNWGAGQRTFSSLHLEPLSNDAMRELLGGLAPGLPDGLVERILDRAEGVPLYAVETVRTLVDQGRLVPEEGTYRPAGDVIELEVPDTLHALIAARLDALPPGDRALLQDAAVLGKTFTTSALSALSGDSEEDLEPRLRDLVRKEVLIFDADPRSPERGQYGFVQSMIREVAYQTLARRDRRARHLAAATFFLQTGDEELAGVVATHFLEAYQAAPEAKESVEVAVQAREALVTAAERASSLGSQDQALRYVGQALELPIEPNERARLWELGADAAVASGQFDAGQAYLERARSWYVDQGDAMAAARITAKLGEAMFEKGDVDPAVRLLQGAMDELGSGADDASTVHLMSQLARAYLFIGDYPNAQVWADRAVAAAEHHDSAGIVADTLITRGISSYLSGRWREGTALLTGALALAEEEGLLLAEVRARLNLADSLGVINPARALTVAKPGLEMARRLGLRLYEVFAAVNGVLPAISTGEWDWADQALEQSAGDDHLDSRVLVMGRMILAAVRGDFERAEDSAIKMEQGVEGSTDAQDHANLYLSKAWLDFTAGRLAEAHRQGLEAARTFTGPTEARATILAGRTALWMGDLDGVREAVQALRQASIRGDWVVNSRRTLEAGLAAKEGRESDAVARYDEAVREWRDLGTPFDLALCHLDRLTVLGPAAPGSDGATREAREIFARLGAVPFIERLNSLIPESQPA